MYTLPDSIKSSVVAKKLPFFIETLESRLQNLHICGRPLGMRRKDKDTIIVADCYLGILSVDVEKGFF